MLHKVRAIRTAGTPLRLLVRSVSIYEFAAPVRLLLGQVCTISDEYTPIQGADCSLSHRT